MRALDLFSAAAGGWSLGLHRAGFTTIAACESVDWRRVLYSENNPHVRVYDDVCTLSAAQIRADLGTLPDIIVGSPPCQDISSANTKGKGVDGPRSGLYFEAVRLVGECRPRWFAFENSANLRTKGADRILSAFEALGYTCEAIVVGGDDIGANHERKRSWLIGFDPVQVADPNAIRWDDQQRGRRRWIDISVPHDSQYATGVGHEGGRPRRHRPDGDGSSSTGRSDASAADANQTGREAGHLVSRLGAQKGSEPRSPSGPPATSSHADEDGQSDSAEHDEVGWSPGSGADAGGPWSDWNSSFAHHLRMDDGLSAWVALTRVAVGGPKGTSAASLIVEAFGDSVLPQIPEAIGRAILRTEAALAVMYGHAS